MADNRQTGGNNPIEEILKAPLHFAMILNAAKTYRGQARKVTRSASHLAVEV
ncbi:hypothetical protein [Sphingobium sp. CFD-1]|uniref:hypothetical protein n=1 Tax=Sphingobium sp. CFD-1 TaxID=2878545 RepID=UPI00214CB815|nr:hypothetical protein [Sphingobium sp. CFD-1]